MWCHSLKKCKRIVRKLWPGDIARDSCLVQWPKKNTLLSKIDFIRTTWYSKQEALRRTALSVMLQGTANVLDSGWMLDGSLESVLEYVFRSLWGIFMFPFFKAAIEYLDFKRLWRKNLKIRCINNGTHYILPYAQAALESACSIWLSRDN